MMMISLISHDIMQAYMQVTLGLGNLLKSKFAGRKQCRYFVILQMTQQCQHFRTLYPANFKQILIKQQPQWLDFLGGFTILGEKKGK